MRIVLLFTIGILMSVSSQAADWRHKVLYGIEGASCLMQAADVATTYGAIQLGAHEANPLIVGTGKGGINWPVAILVKGIVCGAPIGISWYVHRHATEANADITSFIGAASSLGISFYAVGNNLEVEAAQRKINARLGK